MVSIERQGKKVKPCKGEEYEMKQKTNQKVQQMAVIGLLAALVFVFTYLGLDIPSPLGKTKLHFGNVMCLLSGLLFGGLPGGLAAGIGSALFDLMDPAWAPEFWVTFLNKFAMGFVAGFLAEKLRLHPQISNAVAAFCGAMSYCLLYVAKNILWGHFLRGFAWKVAIVETLTVKLPVTLVNALIAVVCSLLLAAVLRPALRRAGVLQATLVKA